MRRACFYHAGCPDGFGAAWAVWRAWGSEVRFVPWGHDDTLDAQDYVGDCVVFVDIAPPNTTLRDLAEVTGQVVVLDHHISALNRYEHEPSLVHLIESMGHTVVFDMEHSGAMLAWMHFHPATPAPEILRYVQDQDLWHWKLPRSREVNAVLSSHPQEFEAWDQLAEKPAEQLADDGATLVRAQRLEIGRALRNAHPLCLANLRLEAVNALTQRSHIGHELATRARYGAPCGAVYRVVGGRVDVSLYSVGSFDVASLAAERGGGGHRNAAGFTVSLEIWARDYLLPS